MIRSGKIICSQNSPSSLVIGNHFFFNEYIKEYQDTLTCRIPAINSLEEFMAAYPKAIVNRAPEPYFPYHSIWSIPPILSILYSANKNPILKKSSDINPQMLNEYNIIYLGSIKTLEIMRHTLLESHFSFHITPHIVTFSPPDGSGAPGIRNSAALPGAERGPGAGVKAAGSR